MRGNRTTISQRGVHSQHRYLVAHFSQDRPFDQLAREILAAQGNTLHKPAANFYRIAPTPDEAAEAAACLSVNQYRSDSTSPLTIAAWS
jgi:hypothetical protein